MTDGIARGAAWMLLFRFADRSLGLVSTLILARVLVPADFGLVAMAMSPIALVELATSFGFEIALIQRATVERVHYDTAWTLTALLGLACAVTIALLAYPMALFFDEPRLTVVMLALALGSAMGGFGNVGVVDFRRRMEFRSEFLLMAGRRLLGFLATIVVALTLRSYWALVVGILTGRVAGLVLSYTMHSYRPRFCLGARNELVSFSRWILANNALIVAIIRVPHFVIGKLFGPQALGLFTLAYDVATMPVTELVSPINRAVFAGYSRLAASRSALRDTYLDVSNTIFAVALPATVGLALVADSLVRLVLGPKWLAAVPLMKILAASAALIAVQAHNGLVHVALGSTATNAVMSLVRLIVLAALCLIFARPYGVTGIAYAELLASGVCLLWSYPLVFRALNISVLDYVRCNWRPLPASAAMAAAVLAVQRPVESLGIVPLGLELAKCVLSGGLVYAIAMIVSWLITGRPRGVERWVLDRLSARLVQKGA